MLYAEITIKIEVDESKLTQQQQEQANKYDKDPFNWDHPLEEGLDKLKDTLTDTVNNKGFFFHGLKKGANAVTVTMSE